ncbi:putative metalloprotease CJM1_0395 family protein [Gilvimarinus sp. SDUM040013]|uniref:Metalloprotease CJM1_0395 family protein n=1 Tax=Gilvimarinus gilvus TaxID=3058038 RepID=A0ABU4RUI6_9GAMM|nr:putative metalloprotease CJM1_0395 family protein [Gilvimarinus sp. SDUM040013]MDO3386741.1 putative metalloprotease CJM1_0395 family protein [Gilvimarinus sp. SDUM040013]MDX6848329.1 putative metalloprotease CJM1_0395 family protein [Gilvimarinus sp. SDUM040013]
MINSLPSNFANAVAPYAPLGRQAVSQESTELKSTSFKPLEESAESARGANERSAEQRSGEVEERERTRILSSAQDETPEAEPDGDSRGEAARDGDKPSSAERQQLEQEQAEIRELSARDREVRSHERAHAAVGGQYAGAPSYQYERGPDGVSYAVSGEVGIDVSAVPGDPQATIEKAEQVRRAALAPAEPSPQDRRVAARAAQLAVEARADLVAEQREAQRLEREQAAEARAQEQAQPDAVRESDSARESELERQAQEQRRREERAQEFAQASARNIDINRRLIEIGVVEPPAGTGSLFSQKI